MSDTPPADLRERADAGDAEAQCDVGKWYAEQSADTDRMALAEHWFRVAAGRGLPRAKHNLGVLAIHRGDTVDGMRLLKEAGDAGWVQSLLSYAALSLRLGNAAAAVEAYRKAVGLGSPDAEAERGWLAFNARTPAGDEEAFRLSSSAAAKGNPTGMVTVAMCLHEGRSRPQDRGAAIAWFRRAAQLGHGGAQAMLGTAYEVGAAVRQDRIEAAAWYTLSSENQNEIGKTMLGSLWRKLTRDEHASAAERAAGLRRQWPDIVSPR